MPGPGGGGVSDVPMCLRLFPEKGKAFPEFSIRYGFLYPIGWNCVTFLPRPPAKEAGKWAYTESPDKIDILVARVEGE